MTTALKIDAQSAVFRIRQAGRDWSDIVSAPKNGIVKTDEFEFFVKDLKSRFDSLMKAADRWFEPANDPVITTLSGVVNVTSSILEYRLGDHMMKVGVFPYKPSEDIGFYENNTLSFQEMQGVFKFMLRI